MASYASVWPISFSRSSRKSFVLLGREEGRRVRGQEKSGGLLVSTVQRFGLDKSGWRGREGRGRGIGLAIRGRLLGAQSGGLLVEVVEECLHVAVLWIHLPGAGAVVAVEDPRGARHELFLCPRDAL
jgi:hypothetical protein